MAATKGNVPAVTAGHGVFFWIGYSAFLVFATTVMWGPAGPYLMLPLLLAWFVYWCRNDGGWTRRSPLVWMAWLFVLYVAVRAVSGYLLDPSTWEQQDRVAADYFRIGGLWAVLLAPWLVGRSGPFNRNLLFGLALVGFLGETAMALPWAELGSSFVARARLVAGPNGSALIAGFFFLLSVVVGPPCVVRLSHRQHRIQAVLTSLVWITLVSMLGLFVLLTQSRSAWLALVLVLVAIAVSAVWAGRRYGSPRQRRLLFAAVGAGAAIMVALVSSQSHLLEKRYEQAQDSLDKVVTLRWSEMETDPVSQRIWLYQFGFPKVLDRPVLGWSPGGVKPLIQANADPPIDHHQHIHNMHLEILLGLGLVGFVLFYGMVAMCFVELGRAVVAGRLPVEWGLFWIAATLFVGIEEIFDTRFFIYEVGAVMALLGALGIACQLDRLSAQGSVSR